MTATEQYIRVLTELKQGDLALLRRHAGAGLDSSVDALDLFSGLWWPLRQKNQRAPRREVAWLVAKLHASVPLPHTPGETLARQMRRCAAVGGRERDAGRFDAMLETPLRHLEPLLRRALSAAGSAHLGVDWVRLTDDLSVWERDETRQRWADEYIGENERETPCL